MIPFNKPYITGLEADHIRRAISRGHLSANSKYTQLCSAWFEERLGFARALPTNSCTAALEMSAMLCNVGVGDQVIMPSYTFVSTALAFAKFGAQIRFVDSLPDHPNMDISQIEPLITRRTKAIVVVHYNGVPCDMEVVCRLARRYDLRVIEDAAHAVNSLQCGKAGDLVCYSFHETKNIHCGEGGLLGVNNPEMAARAAQLWLKGTNRLCFECGEVAKYEWVDTGGSYALSELGAAFLWGQIEAFDQVILRREEQWRRYFDNLRACGSALPAAQGSSHIFYLTCPGKDKRDILIGALSQKGILAPFHYQALHKSPYGSKYGIDKIMPNAERFSDCLVRLPLYYELTDEQIDDISDRVKWVSR